MDAAGVVRMGGQVGIRLSGSLLKKSNRQLPNISHIQNRVLRKGVLFSYKGPFLNTGEHAVVVTQSYNLNLTGVYFISNIRGSDGRTESMELMDQPWRYIPTQQQDT